MLAGRHKGKEGGFSHLTPRWMGDIVSSESTEMRFRVWRGLELLAVLVLAVSFFGLLLMRLGVFHAWPVWLAGILATYGYARRFRQDRQEFLADPPTWHLVLVVLVALIFRMVPYVYQLGGQDEGVYTNMAAYLVHTGGLQPSDTILQTISSQELREAYLQGNYTAKNYLPGIYRVEDGLEFQFYHLFPVWLALAGDIFGLDKIGYALTFLSLVSLLFIQRLAHVLSGSQKAGLVAGLLLAVNPLHAFFSKFPVTEVPTLAFSAIALTFLAVYWRSDNGQAGRRYLVLSAVAFAALFMTRVSGFMYLPLLLSVLFLALLIDRRSPKHGQLVVWAGATVGLYLLSVVYGLRWSRVYAVDIYTSSFEPLLGSHWKLTLLVVAGASAIAWLACWVASWEERRQTKVLRAISPWVLVLPLVIAVATGIAFWKAYKLGYTDAYAEHPWYGKHFHLSHRGLHSLRSTSLIAMMMYVSPLLPLAFFVSALRTKLTPAMSILLVFTTGIFAYIAVLQWVLPYQPYYARYLVSELVPYLLLFVVVSWSVAKPGALRQFLGCSLLVCGIWSVMLTAQQVGKNEHEGVARSLERLVLHLDPQDLVFVDDSLTEPLAHELKTALVYTHDLKVVTVSGADLSAGGYGSRITRPYRDIFFLSRSPVPPEGFTEVDSVDFLEKFYCHGSWPPTDLCVRTDSRLMLYKRTTLPEPVPGDVALAFKGSEDKLGTLVGIRRGDQLVADGRPGFVMYGPYAPLMAGRYTLEIQGVSSRPFVFDMSAKKGRETLHRGDYASGEDASARRLVQVDFELKAPVTDLEVRLNVQAGSDMVVDGYRIVHR